MLIRFRYNESILGRRLATSIEQLDRTTMAENAVRSIREAILNGTVQQGSRLREAALAKQLGISRVPLREALHRLQEEGLVSRVPYRGTVVAEVSDRSAAEIASLRIVLERHAVQLGWDYLASPTGRAEMVEGIRRIEECAKADDHAGVIDAHLAFHGIFYRASDNEVLLSIWSSWRQTLRIYLVAQHEAFPSLATLSGMHRHLLAAIESGDSDRVDEQFRKHFGPTTALHVAESW